MVIYTDRYKRATLKKMTYRQLWNLKSDLRIREYRGADFTIRDLKLVYEAILDKLYEKA